jgi:hypothetical protein
MIGLSGGLGSVAMQEPFSLFVLCKSRINGEDSLIFLDFLPLINLSGRDTSNSTVK